MGMRGNIPIIDPSIASLPVKKIFLYVPSSFPLSLSSNSGSPVLLQNIHTEDTRQIQKIKKGRYDVIGMLCM